MKYKNLALKSTFLRFFMGMIVMASSIFSSHANDNKLRHEEHMDHYRWMETKRAKTMAWLNSHSERSDKIMHSLPWKNALANRLSQIVNAGPTISDIFDAGDNRFYLRSTPEYPYQRLFIKSNDNPERIIIDPPVGYGISFFSPSHDGQYVAYGLSKNGFESTEIKIIQVKEGTILKDSFPNLRYPNVVWAADNQSFYYSKNVSSESMGRQTCGIVYLHRLGEINDIPTFDWRSIDELKPKTCENVNLYSSVNSEHLLVYVSRSISGYGGYLFSAKKEINHQGKLRWDKIIDMSENVSNFVYSGKYLYFSTFNLSSGYDIFRINLDSPASERTKIISWSNGELTGLNISQDSLYITYHESGINKFLRIPFDDINNHQYIHIPYNEEVSALFSNNAKGDILFTRQGWLIPPSIYLYNHRDNTVKDTGLIIPPKSSFSDYEAEELWVKAQDNVQIPLTFIHRKNIKLDGSTPVWLTAYGAYGVSSFPAFDPSRQLWLEQGGAIAIAHVRGGGELGPAWHHEGRVSNKANSISDFIRCAEYLVENKFTSPSRLAISGESAGGIIVGMAMTLRPELFSAVAIDVGILNTSRLAKIPIGPMNYEEFGSPYTRIGKHSLLTIDAYKHLKAGIRYPPTLLTVGLYDRRVSPWQTAKFAARLEELNQRWNIPVLVLADKNSGHNASTYEDADSKFINIVSFFIWKTGMNYQVH